MTMLWISLVVFVVVFVIAYLVVNNLYLTLENKALKEKLSWYTHPVKPVSMVWAEPEEYVNAEE